MSALALVQAGRSADAAAVLAGDIVELLRDTADRLEAAHIENRAARRTVDGAIADLRRACGDVEQLETVRALLQHHLGVSRDENVALGAAAAVVEDSRAQLLELCTMMRDVTGNRLAAAAAEYRALNTVHARLGGPGHDASSLTPPPSAAGVR